MEKSHFVALLKNYTAISREDTLTLAAIKKIYPYSQPIQALTAYGLQKNNMDGKAEQLQLTAVYATDRSVLKAIFEGRPSLQPDHVEQPLEKARESIKIENPLQGDELLAEVFKDINRLKAVKYAFELSAKAFEQNKGQAAGAVPTAEKKTERPGKARRTTARDTQGIIAEIINSKKKIKPSDLKQKEQLEIIDHFIRTKPSIGKSKTDQGAQDGDLAETSTQFTENIISETLVEILVKQGKKDKAVEVLRKLIWKYPQKKAYFAAQIQELTS